MNTTYTRIAANPAACARHVDIACTAVTRGRALIPSDVNLAPGPVPEEFRQLARAWQTHNAEALIDCAEGMTPAQRRIAVETATELLTRAIQDAKDNGKDLFDGELFPTPAWTKRLSKRPEYRALTNALIEAHLDLSAARERCQEIEDDLSRMIADAQAAGNAADSHESM